MVFPESLAGLRSEGKTVKRAARIVVYGVGRFLRGGEPGFHVLGESPSGG